MANNRAPVFSSERSTNAAVTNNVAGKLSSKPTLVSSPTTERSLFDFLPAEMVAEIFLIAVEDDCQKYCKPVDSAFKYPAGFKSNLLAPIHISSRIRSINLGHPPFWRSIVQKILHSSGQSTRKIRFATEQLFKLAAQQSSHTLSDVDFWKFDLTSCAKKGMDLLALTSLSAASLKTLRLPAVMVPLPLHPCQCQSCRLTTFVGLSAVDRIWSSVFRLLYEAASLKRLSFDLPDPTSLPWSEMISKQALKVRARPEELALSFSSAGTASGHLSWLSALASRVQCLTVSVSGWSQELNAGIATPGQVMASIVQAASTTLRELEFEGTVEELNLVGLLRCGLPRLESIDIYFVDDDYQAPPLPTSIKRNHLDCLTSIEAPAWAVRLIKAPHIRRMALQLSGSSEAGYISSRVQEWLELEDLVIGVSHVLSPQEGTAAIQVILRALTPCDNGALRCPTPLRLGLGGQWCWSLGWLADDDKETPGKDAWGLAPVIGFDLFRLDQKRRANSETKSSEENLRYRPPDTIKVRDCLVDPMAWTLIVEAAAKGERRVCYPDPVALQAEVLLGGEDGTDEAYRVLPRLATVLYSLNTPLALEEE